MSPELLSRIMDDILLFPKHPVLRLLPHGELSEYKYLTELIQQLHPVAKRLPVVANTNGINLDILEPLLPLLTILEVSLNAVNELQYRRLRIGSRKGDFLLIHRKLGELADRAERGELNCKIVVSFLRYPGINESSWEEFSTIWSERGLEPILREFHSFSNHVYMPSFRRNRNLPPCKSIFTRMTVTAEGRFVRCYNDIDQTDVIEDMSGGKSLQDLWFCEKNIRGMLFMLGEHPKPTFCSSCNDRVCADPEHRIGIGKPFEEHAWDHHAKLERKII